MEDGYYIAMLININSILNNIATVTALPNHWIGLESIDIIGDKVKMKVYTWGVFEEKEVNLDNFKKGYCGYVAGK